MTQPGGQREPPTNGAYRNGVDKRRPQGFTPWFWSGRAAAKLEAAIVVLVFAGVFAIMGYLFQMPGPLVVHVQDDLKEPIKEARVRCVSPDGKTTFVGQTDVFGEAKWPGLEKGAWRCEVTAPARFHAPPETGFATVVARHPAMWTTSIERPARLVVEVVRPEGAPRAPVAVRAVCGGDTWEGRAGLLNGRATLYLPPGRPCRAGLVRPELPFDGPVAQPVLECGTQPCTRELTGGVGQELAATLRPSAGQWAAARPPPEPEPEQK